MTDAMDPVTPDASATKQSRKAQAKTKTKRATKSPKPQKRAANGSELMK